MNLSETAEVLSKMAVLRAEDRPMALATIVSVRGSTYRRPGARLLVPEAGESVGNLSGGCLEGEVEQVARDVMGSTIPRLELYDLTADDEAVWGWGLGCNGAIEVFVEPAERAAEIADALTTAIEEERPVAVATVIESSVQGVSVGARMMVHADGSVHGGLGEPTIDEGVGAAAGTALAAGQTETRRLDVGAGEVRIFIESLTPPLRLVVCGAGHDARPVVASAAALGWKVVVVDDREEFLDHLRFPEAAAFVHTDPSEAAAAVEADDRTYVLVMSHNYLRDRAYLGSFLGTDVAYIGMLGPRARLERLLDDLSSAGAAPSRDDVAKIHGPAGLDVGGEGPEEIAAAVVAEVLAVSRARNGGFLKERSGPIHDRREPMDTVPS